MSKNIFSGLEDLGFDNVSDVDLYKKKVNKEVEQQVEQSEDEKLKSHLYDRQVTCPVCENIFKARAVKTSSYRVIKQDSDLFINYALVNPYFYDVWICNSCGYSAMKNDFNKIRSFQIDSIKQKITSKWNGKSYPDVYDINIAIERYKLSLLNYFVMEAKASKKAMNCLKLAWMYRILGDSTNEMTFLKQALAGFNDGYFNEDFPIYGMDKFTCMYLIGELNRRVGNNSEAMSWFSQVIVTQGVPQKLKDRARDQKDIIVETEKENANMDESNFSGEKDKNNEPKKGFFSRFFK
ncbi:DUF2225 domain-containing protein [Clostridium magnum]|uniref:DUF2225 domain-containing protein n=1 Tax=Clostridium magnum DSM 2767 TaxID=1121326 RepID=A0A161WEL7_9CLOT|nr:DUF2225 domain-containing protein [Clostridium magnum]KZL90115.1 hypothetical protein CLMAG_46060 [Clostridium magnum DSM 2767]SHH61181.1 hypothetical protein SAMN02745944_00984 [Clostridium magnum DSM 2767]